MTIRVLIVDDSALIRSLLSEIIHQAPDLELVGAAPDAFIAKEMVMNLQPDVITLDIEMPKVDGLTFLDRLMKAKPIPVIMISTLTEKGADATLRSLELGAIDFIAKPKVNVAHGIAEYQQEIIDKIRIASAIKLRKRAPQRDHLPAIPIQYKGTETIVGIGASTGGTEAIRKVLERLSPGFPATVITQHMPPNFTKSFAQRLDGLCEINVHEAQVGERILTGHAYIAPGDKHMEIVKSGADYKIRLNDGPLVSGHKPAVDLMFESIAKAAGKNAIGALLTGMGKDGAEGLLSMFNAGAITMIQDEETSVVWGMPKAAAAIGATKHIFPLEKIATALTKAVEQKGGATRL
jgi:two-component system chemotaxis response regulator CheB